jgi:hypothetical protein
MQLINICALNQTTAITAGYIGANTFVYKTTNSGANWTQVFTENNGFINAVRFLNNGSLLMMGDPAGGRWSLWKSTNQGTSWDSTGMYLDQNGTEAGWNNGMWNLGNGAMVWFGTNSSRIYYSTNFGGSWTAQSTAPEVNSYAIWFPMSGTEGLFGGATLMRTSNYGSNWTQVSSLGTGNFGGIAGTPLPVSDATIFEYVWYVRGTNIIYFASNNASNWVADHTAPSGTYRHIGGSIGGPFWAVRNNGGISFHARILGITKLDSEIPEKYVLHQNYPNPFNPSTTIEFDLPKSSFVILKVYNSLGQEIEKPVNENLTAGKYEYKWNARNLTSGVYFYSVEAGDFRDTRKMIVVK